MMVPKYSKYLLLNAKAVLDILYRILRSFRSCYIPPWISRGF